MGRVKRENREAVSFSLLLPREWYPSWENREAHHGYQVEVLCSRATHGGCSRLWSFMCGHSPRVTEPAPACRRRYLR